MGFFHALYFVSHTATTIGFGELPLPFTAAQRLWVTFMIYASVVGWAFVIGKLLALFNDKGFVQAVRVQRFAARVRQMGEPFYLVAGYGETGQLLCRALFEAFRGHLVMVPSEIIAHEIFALITTPLMARFLGIIKQKDNTWAETVAQRLLSEVGPEVSAVWSVRIDRIEAPAVLAAARVTGAEVALEVLLRDPSLRDRLLTAVPLLLVRADAELLLPEATAPLQPGDHVLFAGTRRALALQRLILRNVNALDYVRTGRDAPGGWIWQWLNRRQAA
jgi:hypothetical protein